MNKILIEIRIRTFNYVEIKLLNNLYHKNIDLKVQENMFYLKMIENKLIINQMDPLLIKLINSIIKIKLLA